MNSNNEIDYLLKLIDNDLSQDPVKKIKGTLFTLKTPVSRHLESDCEELRFLKNFARSWVRDHEHKYNPSKCLLERSKYVSLAKKLLSNFNNEEEPDFNILRSKFDYIHYGLKSSRTIIILMLINMLTIIVSLKVLADINQGALYFFSKSSFVIFSCSFFGVTLIGSIFCRHLLNDLSEVVVGKDYLTLLRPYCLKFYRLEDIKVCDSYTKYIGFDKVEYFKYSVGDGSYIELSDKLLGIEALKDRLNN